MSSFHIQRLDRTTQTWANQFLERHWGTTQVVSRGQLYDAATLPGFVAFHNNEPVGLVTYRLDGDTCELMTINTDVEGRGIGTRLVTAVRESAIAANCRRLWLITTNDNLAALGFYQKRGFRITAVHPNALAVSRRLKPQIPLVGLNGIPLRDEIELAMELP
ncbi:MAG: GNAT family N-acetyltransferase [Chloroflexi bacterium]|nr:GNAT family N-acetyltransferase [Chloroflexota bacterium]